jgi:hypothetical protein
MAEGSPHWVMRCGEGIDPFRGGTNYEGDSYDHHILGSGAADRLRPWIPAGQDPMTPTQTEVLYWICLIGGWSFFFWLMWARRKY